MFLVIKNCYIWLYKYYNYLQLIFSWFIIIYAEFVFLFVLLIANLFIFWSHQQVVLVDFIPYDLNYLPNYLKFDDFFHIEKFLLSEEYLLQTVDYDLLNASLDEVDFLFDDNLISKPIKYMQWHHLPTWSFEEEESWIKLCNKVMEENAGNFTHEFERFFLKYILNDPGFKNYMPPKYRSWRYLEAFYIRYLLDEIKNHTVVLERWILLKRCVYTRLCSKRQGSYLFRCFDTYLNMYYTYEIMLNLTWTISLNKRVAWMMREYYRRKPWVIGTILALKFVFGVGVIYGWWQILPFD